MTTKRSVTIADSLGLSPFLLDGKCLLRRAESTLEHDSLERAGGYAHAAAATTAAIDEGHLTWIEGHDRFGSTCRLRLAPFAYAALMLVNVRYVRRRSTMDHSYGLRRDLSAPVRAQLFATVEVTVESYGCLHAFRGGDGRLLHVFA